MVRKNIIDVDLENFIVRHSSFRLIIVKLVNFFKDRSAEEYEQYEEYKEYEELHNIIEVLLRRLRIKEYEEKVILDTKSIDREKLLVGRSVACENQ